MDFDFYIKSGGRGTRTPMGLRPAVFKTAAIPIMRVLQTVLNRNSKLTLFFEIAI